MIPRNLIMNENEITTFSKVTEEILNNIYSKYS